jgi:pyruvate,orthophosphate dikinase
MPGMLDTVLNLGLNEATIDGLARRTSPRFAYDTYHRFVALFACVVLGVPQSALDPAEVTGDPTAHDEVGDASPEVLRDQCEALLRRVEARLGQLFPRDPRVLRSAVEAVLRPWNGAKAQAYRRREGLDDRAGTAVNVQAMVFGNRDDESGTGVVFTRDPVTGERRAYGDVLFRAQGEDVVSGSHVTTPIAGLAVRMPTVAAELAAILERLEEHYRDMCDVEFTIESGTLWLLQTRVGKRTGQAAVRMAVNMVGQLGWQISRDEALRRVTPEQLEQALARTTTSAECQALTVGEPASPGVATGRAYFSAEDCAGRRRTRGIGGARTHRDLSAGRPRDATRRGRAHRARWPCVACGRSEPVTRLVEAGCQLSAAGGVSPVLGPLLRDNTFVARWLRPVDYDQGACCRLICGPGCRRVTWPGR